MSFETAAAEAAAPDQGKLGRGMGCVSVLLREGSTPDGRSRGAVHESLTGLGRRAQGELPGKF